MIVTVRVIVIVVIVIVIVMVSRACVLGSVRVPGVVLRVCVAVLHLFLSLLR